MLRELLVGVTVTRGVYEGLRRVRRGGARLGERRNRAGRTVDLCAGPAVALGTAAALAVVPRLPGRQRAGAVAGVLAAAACGAYDDVVGARDPRRGFRAHLGALRQGELTTGAVKLVGVGAAALAAGVVLKERPADRLLAAVVIAGSAHAVNVLDVRPGRAGGAVLALGAGGMARGPVAAACTGAAAAVLPDDVRQRTMLGDTGAHALGAGLGLAVVAANGRAGLLAHTAVLLAVALAEEARNPQSG
ncbi:hypothetical protein GCM10010218_23280 [Streptomyces mashuensis]|uniref:Uncharacterized protein n=1 Tax=Streptomyces mashuensis TaxID=33904 RepID=A0A919B2Q1_9ACTN|nr:hypothetical protein [Streptomyces mashuensis]GHF41197.1 hypothetical protein GCM10010218_23280 [Streptomyces mashuensis]